ncbi:protein kinase-like protein [Purpureocillium lavendulum]|uniref:Protein kinase-like protein n=1 Tax=Purpureocillium lavendulum TaxID=1247861 RepID=A0AB34G8I0_9HYPO|nr:protein kinase-like protein [Purpureocillium lavendulum]
MLDDSLGTSAHCISPATAARCRDDDLEPHPGVDAFFRRNGLCPSTRLACHTYACLRFPTAVVRCAPTQGYCSYTLSVSGDRLLQFRPEPHELDMRVCRDARAVFKDLVPATVHLGSLQGTADPAGVGDGAPRLHVYVQERLPGVSLAHVKEQTGEQRRRLIEDIAHVFAASYAHRHPPPDGGTSEMLRGRVGASLKWRLQLLQGLRDADDDDDGDERRRGQGGFARHVAAVTGRADAALAALPWCLTHGDLVPSNVLVDAESGRLTGLVDWAEGEWLPLGLGLYGLEELLGRDVPSRGFVYFDDHESLRRRFWDCFLAATAACRQEQQSARLLDDVGLARKLGILLWRGIAFDDGRIDRVVEAGGDDAEVHKLRLFLEAPCPTACAVIEGSALSDGDYVQRL